MSFWRGLPASVIIHVAAAGIVLASISPGDGLVEDVASAPVELVLDIESSPHNAQQTVSEEVTPEEPAEAPAPDPPETGAAGLAETGPVPPPPRDLPPPLVPTPESLSRQAGQYAVFTARTGAEPLPAAPEAAAQAPPERTEPVTPAKKRTETQQKRKKAKPDAKTEPRSKKASRQTAALAAGRGSDGQIRSTDGLALEQTYKSKVLARLRSVKRYPEAARRKGLEGTAILSFTVNARGQVTAARISTRSGHAAIDGAALAMARNAAPFPPFPAGMGRQRMSFRVPVKFTID